MHFPPREMVFRNRIIELLPMEELRAIRPLLTRVRLMRGQVIYDSGERIDQLYFIEDGLVSMAPPYRNAREQVEVDYVGRQGAVGLTALLNAEAASFHRTIVQMPGLAYQLAARPAREILHRLPVLGRLLKDELNITTARVSQNSACRTKHSLAARLARWLLVVTRDLIVSDTLNVTQELLATMLAVRRPGVTVALGRLEASGLIRSRRGHIVICGREGLAAIACDCEAHLDEYANSLKSRRPDPCLSISDDLQSRASF